MKEVIDFFSKLAVNNNKPWFDEHKDEYLAVKKKIEELSVKLIEGAAAFDHRIHDLQPKDVTYRIYRDIRFSPDKTPYKHWCGVYVCPGGKKSGMAGYYVHFEPCSNTYFVCGGLYNPSKEVLKSVRDSIMLEPEKFHKAVLACGNDYHLSWDAALKKLPRGYNADDAHSEYYRLKSFEIAKPITEADVTSKKFVEMVLAEWQKTHQFNELLNKCYDFVGEQ